MSSGELDMMKSGTHNALDNEAVFEAQGTRATRSDKAAEADQELGQALQAVSRASQKSARIWKDRAFEMDRDNQDKQRELGIVKNTIVNLGNDLASAGEEYELLHGEYQKLSVQLDETKLLLAEYKGQGGTINMDRSWKTKYRNALAEANQRLNDAGLDTVRIRKETIAELKVFEAEQMKMQLSQGSNGQGEL